MTHANRAVRIAAIFALAGLAAFAARPARAQDDPSSGTSGSEAAPTPVSRPTTGDIALDSLVESLIPRLADTSPRVRSAVRAALVDAGPDALPLLEHALATMADGSTKRGLQDVLKRLGQGPGSAGAGARRAGAGGGGGRAGAGAGRGGVVRPDGRGAGAGKAGLPRAPLLTADRVMEVVDATADQKPKITGAFDEFESSRRAAAEEMRQIGDPSIVTDRLDRLRETLDERLKVILNPEQYQKYRSQFGAVDRRSRDGGGDGPPR